MKSFQSVTLLFNVLSFISLVPLFTVCVCNFELYCEIYFPENLNNSSKKIKILFYKFVNKMYFFRPAVINQYYKQKRPY